MKLRNLIFMALFGLCALSCGKDDDPTPTPNENNAPDYGDNQSVTVSEAISDTYVIGTYTATDADEEDVLAYSTNSSVFEIDAESGQLSLADGQSLDADDSPYSVTLTVSDSEATDSITVTITVTEEGSTVNEPPVMEDQEFSVDERIHDGVEIGPVIATDNDSETLTFSIKTNSDNLFEITEDGNLSLANGAGLDAWKAASHEIMVSVADEENTVDATITINVNDTRSFITTWKTDTDGETVGFGDLQDEFYECNIKWGDEVDDSFETHVATTPPSHVYEAAGTYTVKIRYGFSRLLMDNNPSAAKLLSIDQWGTTNTWQSFENAFEGCVNMEYNATDAPDLSQVTSLWAMFYGCSSFNGDLSNWNVSGITNMGHMFNGASSFNGDVSNWDISEVTQMNYMFYGATAFNQELNWNVSKVTTMNGMFGNAISFNGNISGWTTTAALENTAFMFYGATAFNQDLSGWDVSKVKYMQGMFSSATAFDQNLGAWNLSSVVTSVLGLGNMLDNSGLSPANYNYTLDGWANFNETPQEMILGALGLTYCDEGIAARQALIENANWTINGDSQCQDP